MTARLDYRTELPDAIVAMSGLERVVESSTLEPLLLELVRQRASQINGWNRLAVGFRRPVGSYVSHRHPEPRAAG